MNSTKVVFGDQFMLLQQLPLVVAAAGSGISRGTHNGLRAAGDAAYPDQQHTWAAHTLVFGKDEADAHLSPRMTGRHQAGFDQSQPEVRAFCVSAARSHAARSRAIFSLGMSVSLAAFSPLLAGSVRGLPVECNTTGRPAGDCGVFEAVLRTHTVY